MVNLNTYRVHDYNVILGVYHMVKDLRCSVYTGKIIKDWGWQKMIEQ
jgi:hypothetical protein